jgi:hypothetical protein
MKIFPVAEGRKERRVRRADGKRRRSNAWRPHGHINGCRQPDQNAVFVCKLREQLVFTRAHRRDIKCKRDVEGIGAWRW